MFASHLTLDLVKGKSIEFWMNSSMASTWSLQESHHYVRYNREFFCALWKARNEHIRLPSNFRLSLGSTIIPEVPVQLPLAASWFPRYLWFVADCRYLGFTLQGWVQSDPILQGWFLITQKKGKEKKQYMQRFTIAVSKTMIQEINRSFKLMNTMVRGNRNDDVLKGRLLWICTVAGWADKAISGYNSAVYSRDLEGESMLGCNYFFVGWCRLKEDWSGVFNQ